MSNADVEILPGWNRADVLFLAECLEGARGEGRRSELETTERAAKFIRAVLADRERPTLVLPVVNASQR